MGRGSWLAWNGNGHNKSVINSLVVVVACSSSSSWELCNGCATWLPRGVWTLTGSARTTQPTHHHSNSGHLHHCHHHLYVHHHPKKYKHTDGKVNNLGNDWSPVLSEATRYQISLFVSTLAQTIMRSRSIFCFSINWSPSVHRTEVWCIDMTGQTNIWLNMAKNAIHENRTKVLILLAIVSDLQRVILEGAADAVKYCRRCLNDLLLETERLKGSICISSKKEDYWNC